MPFRDSLEPFPRVDYVHGHVLGDQILYSNVRAELTVQRYNPLEPIPPGVRSWPRCHFQSRCRLPADRVGREDPQR